MNRVYRRKRFYQSVTQATQRKRPSSPNRSRTYGYDLLYIGRTLQETRGSLGHLTRTLLYGFCSSVVEHPTGVWKVIGSTPPSWESSEKKFRVTCVTD